MMQDGLQLMAVGMTVVFSFLGLLVAAMALLGAYFERFPAPAGAGSPAGAGLPAGAGSPAGAPGT
ncbi:MAG: OadG family transporter subunit, partial [Spirochaetota bacterium]